MRYLKENEIPDAVWHQLAQQHAQYAAGMAALAEAHTECSAAATVGDPAWLERAWGEALRIEEILASLHAKMV